MPNPKPGESKSDYLKRCIPQVLDDGTAQDNDQAVAICNSMFEKAGKSMPGKAISKREDVKPKEGVGQYGDVAFADEKNKKYPIDTEEHIRAAWNYINKESNAGKYDAGVQTIKNKIISAWKRKIDPKGPPSAQNGKSRTMPLLADAMIEAALKAGARHSQADQKHIQAAHDHLRDCGASCDAVNTDMEAQAGVSKSLALKCLGMEPDEVLSYAQQETLDIGEAAGALSYLASLARGEAGEEEPDDVSSLADIMRKLLEFIGGEIDEMEQSAASAGKSLDLERTLVAYGTEIKALGNGLMGGYLARFSSQQRPDVTGDFFNGDTDFGPAHQSDVYYHHGLDVKVGKRKLANRAEIGKDDIGVWIKHQLDLRDEYEQAIYQMASEKKMGWSSGTAAHLVERVRVGKAMWIKHWPLGLDASYTPTPAEPSNDVVPLKSLRQVPGRAELDNSTKRTDDGSPQIPDELLELGQMIQRKAGLLL